MSFLKELSRYLLKFSEIVINKTEILVQLAKLKIEIKKREIKIDKFKIDIGNYVIKQFEGKQQISEDVLKIKIANLNKFRIGINELNIEFEDTWIKLFESSDENKEENES